MNGLAPATIVMLYLFATTLGAVALVQLHFLVKVVTGLDVVAAGRAVPGLGRRALSFLERAFRGRVESFLDALEWVIYGVRHA